MDKFHAIVDESLGGVGVSKRLLALVGAAQWKIVLLSIVDEFLPKAPPSPLPPAIAARLAQQQAIDTTSGSLPQARPTPPAPRLRGGGA